MGFLRRLFKNGKARNQKMRNIAAELNFHFSDLNDTGLFQQLSEFKLFNHGKSPKITNVLSSEVNINTECHVFDYSYIISTGKSSHEYNQTVLFINSKELSLPQFYQRPETIFTKLLSFLGYSDINFENFPEYSRNYHLKGEFEDVIRSYFSKDVLNLLTAQKDLYMEGMNYYLILYQKGELCQPGQLNSFRNLGLMLYHLFLLQSKANTEDMNAMGLNEI